MRKKSTVMNKCNMMFNGMDLDPDIIIHKTKLLLNVYREVVWTSKKKTTDLRDYSENTFGKKFDEALLYLINFAPDVTREKFECKVSCLFETKWLIEIIDMAMTRIYDYPIHGQLYHEILTKQYLCALKYSEQEMLEITNVERSIYFDRKKEAVYILSIALWSYAVPHFKGIFNCNIEADNLEIPTFSRLSSD